MRFPALSILLLCALTTRAATQYVRDGASGAATGADWTDAFDDIPATLTRGDTYYLADGTYTRYNWNDAVSGDLRITIKKATTYDHGTETGWSSGYGDGQALFLNSSGTHAHQVNTDNWTFDGGTNSPYGLYFASDSTSAQVFNLGVTAGTGDNSILRYVEIGGHGRGTNGEFACPAQTGGLTSWGGASNVLVQYVWVHGAATLLDAVSNWTIEHSRFTDSRCDDNPAGAHANVVYCGYGATNLVFRWNWCENYNDEGFFITGYNGSPRNIWAYGNVFYSPGTRYSRAFEFRPDYSYTNIFIYNNTIANMTLIGIHNRTAETGNITEDCAVVNNLGYSTTFTLGDIDTQLSNTVAGASSVFVNYAATNFHLAAANPGSTTLSSPFTIDYDGNTNNTSIGAFKFDGEDPPTPTITTLRVGTLILR